MKIVLTGGGSGGHITPLLAVASEIKKLRPKVELIYIGQTGDSFAKLPAEDPNVDKVYTVRAGKFRRYNSEGLKQLLDISTVIKNIRDAFLVVIGLMQSYFLIRKIKPDLVFSRGGFVSVPVCLGAKLNGVGYLTHDSDPVPSLTNRIIGRWAKLHLVAQPKDIYPYPKDKTITTGVPVSKYFVPVDKKVREEYRQKLNIESNAKMLFIIGGGLGAAPINAAVQESLPNLFGEFEHLRVVHVVGSKNEEQAKKIYDEILSDEQKKQVEVLAFTDKVYMYSGAADLVVTRAGATNLAEFELQGVACIVIPSTVLVGGHQLMNAQLLKNSGAAVVIRDEALTENTQILAKEVSSLLKNPDKLKDLGKEISKFAHPNALEEIAEAIINSIEAP